MPEYGAIFDYQLSTMVFGYLTIGLMTVFTCVAIWATARAMSGAVSKIRVA
jgi:hypothetical protein